jgi:hypothetical protein
MEISFEEAYKEACTVIGELIMTPRLAQMAHLQSIQTPPPANDLPTPVPADEDDPAS